MTADAATKGASERPEEPIPINHADWRSIIRNALVGEWKQRWETCRDKLREIKPNPEIWIGSGKYSRRDEVIISRMRLGHTLLTHGYLVVNVCGGRSSLLFYYANAIGWWGGGRDARRVMSTKCEERLRGRTRF